MDTLNTMNGIYNMKDICTNNDTHMLTWTQKDYRILQSFWEMHLRFEYYISSPVYPIITTGIFYFSILVPWTIIDMYGKDWKWIQKYKIQPDNKVTWTMLRRVMSRNGWNMILYVAPFATAEWIWRKPTVLPPLAPSVFEIVWQNFAALAVFDFEFFIWHFIHHKVRFLYKHIHSIHHQYHSPNGWVAQYVHPFELLTLGFFSTTSPWVIGCHPLTTFIFQHFMVAISIDAHVGYDLPFMPHRWFPFYGGSVKHDMHHQRPLTNYAPFYNYLDQIFGTFCPPQLAGGYKSRDLQEWENQHKAKKQKLKEERDQTATLCGLHSVHKLK